MVRRQLRLRAGITQNAIAKAVDVDRATVSRWEAGSRTPAGENLVRYLEVLELLRLESGR
jgi:transcriptional regulator with XRE-family HTH domain